MKTRTVRTILRMCISCGLAVYLTGALSLSAATLYVSLESMNRSPPYTNWGTAATDIQAAVDAAKDGDTVLVTNGVYATGARDLSLWSTNVSPPRMMTIWPSRVVVTNAIRLESVNGPGVTFVDGGRETDSDGLVIAGTRCVYLGNDAVLSGFTLTNGLAAYFGFADGTPVIEGGGILASASAGVTNCILTGSLANRGGGVCGGILYNCVVTNNMVKTHPMIFVTAAGGGAYRSTLHGCVLTRNDAGPFSFGPSGGGGGALDSVLTNCRVIGNQAGRGGGAWSCFLTNCMVRSNTVVGEAYGGGVYYSTVMNCLIEGNTATSGGGASGSTCYNSILTGNSAHGGGGAYLSSLHNCVLTDNLAYGKSYLIGTS